MKGAWIVERLKIVWHRLGARGRGWLVELGMILVAVVLGLIVGRAGGELWGASTPTPAPEAGASSPRSVDADSASSSSNSSSPNLRPRPEPSPDKEEGDWADSAPVPAWVTDPGERPDINASPDEPAGSRNARSGDVTSEGSEPTPPTATGAPSESSAPIEPVVIERVSGPRVRVYDTPGGTTPDTWALLGACGNQVRTGGAGRGREAGSVGSWLFALATSHDVCRRASLSSPHRSPPDRDVRRRLAAATQSSDVVRQLGAPWFSPEELADFVSTRLEDGRKIGFGVFRKEVGTTQVSPPPPLPQLAFVARWDPEGRWILLWGKFTAERTERIGLAGVHDSDSDGVPDAFFGVRGSDGSRLLVVGSGDGSSWGLSGARSLGGP